MTKANCTTKSDPKYLARQREYRARTGNASTLKYERTKNGKLMRIYRNMLSRVTGVQAAKYHLYRGKYILPKQEFYDWAVKQDKFHILFKQWEQSGYERKMAPSVDRVDSSQGYETWNMEWVTHSENSRRGAIARNA